MVRRASYQGAPEPLLNEAERAIAVAADVACTAAAAGASEDSQAIRHKAEGARSGELLEQFSPASLGGSQGHAPDLLKNDKWCWSRNGVEPSDRGDRRWPCSPAAARTRRGPSSRRLVPARSARGYSGWRLRLLRVVKSCENRQVAGPYRAESVVTVHHGLTGSLWVSTAPVAARLLPDAGKAHRALRGTWSAGRHH